MASINEIIAWDEEFYMQTFGSRHPVAFTRGYGSKLVDTEGREYTDFIAGIATNALGYSHPGFTNSVVTQIRSGVIHTSSLFYVEQQALLAKKLSTAAGGGWRAFFANSGAEANEGAVKLARRFFSRKDESKYEIVTALNSFHGRTLAMVSATGQPKYQQPYLPMPEGFIHVPLNDINALKSAVSERTCAIFLETIQGEGGVIEATPAYLRQARELCDELGILLIFDEVQTGMGRTGSLFSFQQCGITPDIFTLAKALGNGIPIGAVMANERASVFSPGDHGSTFGGNPLACSAALAVLEAMESEHLPEKAAETGEYFRARLEGLRAFFPFIRTIRGKGLLLGMELADTVNGREIVGRALENGFIINCAAHNTLRFAPPLIIGTGEIDALIAVLEKLFQNYLYN